MEKRVMIDGVISDWDDELIKVARVDLDIALMQSDPVERDSMVNLAKDTLNLVGTC